VSTAPSAWQAPLVQHFGQLVAAAPCSRPSSLQHLAYYIPLLECCSLLATHRYGVSSVALAIFGVQDGGAVIAGPGAALLGPAAALGLAFPPTNRDLLSPKQRGACAAAAAALAAVCLTQLDLEPTVTPLDDALGPWIYASSALVGVLLGWLAGPQLQAQRELNIKEASWGGGTNVMEGRLWLEAGGIVDVKLLMRGTWHK